MHQQISPYLIHITCIRTSPLTASTKTEYTQILTSRDTDRGIWARMPKPEYRVFSLCNHTHTNTIPLQQNKPHFSLVPSQEHQQDILLVPFTYNSWYRGLGSRSSPQRSNQTFVPYASSIATILVGLFGTPLLHPLFLAWTPPSFCAPICTLL